jgi:hypothetical protein
VCVVHKIQRGLTKLVFVYIVQCGYVNRVEAPTELVPHSRGIQADTAARAKPVGESRFGTTRRKPPVVAQNVKLSPRTKRNQARALAQIEQLQRLLPAAKSNSASYCTA